MALGGHSCPGVPIGRHHPYGMRGSGGACSRVARSLPSGPREVCRLGVKRVRACSVHVSLVKCPGE